MNLARRTVYNALVYTIRVYQRMFLDFHVWGREHISKGPTIFVTNHISTMDAFWFLPIFPEPVHIILGPAYKFRWMARIWDAFEQISARPAQLMNMTASAVEYLRKGESIVIAPEGNLQELFRLGTFYPGVVAIYRQFRAPIVPLALVAPKCRLRTLPLSISMDGQVYPTRLVLRGTYCINIGEPCMPEWPEGISHHAQNEFLLNFLKQRIAALMEDARVNKFWLEVC